MKYSLIDGKRVEPEPELRGRCPYCGAIMISRCGEVKVWHWAHKGERNCDPWWENETEWHREWKNRFPKSWQETIFEDEDTDEKHIADVRTEEGFVIEFQHSHIKLEEVGKMESFYQRMIWVINGTRRKTDSGRGNTHLAGSGDRGGGKAWRDYTYGQCVRARRFASGIEVLG